MYNGRTSYEYYYYWIALALDRSCVPTVGVTRGSPYVVRVTSNCRTRSVSRLSRPGADSPLSEGSGAKFEVYLGIATAARAL